MSTIVSIPACSRKPDLELLNAFATQAAVAIENARLYTQTDESLAYRVNELETLTISTGS